MRLSLILLIGLIPNLLAKEKPVIHICSTNPVYCQIIKNSPKLDRKYAMKLSNAIYAVAILYDIDPKKYAAILAQESMYKLNAHNKQSKDYGISQINHNTAKAYGFNVKRLTTDLGYSIEAGAIVLADMKKMYGNKDPEYWTRYNASDRTKRKKYKTLVARYM
jgi:soluble lytic murein transglycosylase-like protein